MITYRYFAILGSAGLVVTCMQIPEHIPSSRIAADHAALGRLFELVDDQAAAICAAMRRGRVRLSSDGDIAEVITPPEGGNA